MPLDVVKWQALQVGTKKKVDYEMCGVNNLKRVQCAEDLAVRVVSHLKFSQPCNDAANKASRMLGFVKRNSSFKNKDVMLTLYNSSVRPAQSVPPCSVSPPCDRHC